MMVLAQRGTAGGVLQVLGKRAFTAEGAGSAEKIEKKEAFLPTFLLSLSVLRVLRGERV
jgi:hypothetical protein